MVGLWNRILMLKYCKKSVPIKIGRNSEAVGLWSGRNWRFYCIKILYWQLSKFGIFGEI